MFTTLVPVRRALASYTEKVGGTFKKVRPGPPQVSAKLKSNSSPPLPSSTFSRESPFASAIRSRSSFPNGSG